MTAVNLKTLLKKANKHNYAIAGLVVITWEDALAYTEAADETGIPIILQAGPSCRAFTPISILGKMFRYLAAQTKTPICCHLDHGFSYRECKEGIDSGFTSVMFDGSKMPLKKNINISSKISHIAHKYNISVEGEIGEVGYFDTATDVAGEANLSSNPYKDLHGNALTRVALVQEPEVPTDQLNSRAQLMLTELSRVKKVLNLDLEQYEVSGDMKPGDFIFAFDPDIGFVDTSAEATAESRNLYEVTFRGQVITPVKVRVTGLTFPIANGMGVYFRDKDGNYTDLTQYVQF